MNKRAFLAPFVAPLAASTLFIACTFPAPVPEGGNNGNDRSNGGEQGEVLLTGAMVVSPDGTLALMQRNETSVLLDLQKMQPAEMPEQVERFVFTKAGGAAIAVMHDQSVVAYALPSMEELWRTASPFEGGRATLARLSDDDQHLVLGDTGRILVLDAIDGEVRGSLEIEGNPEELSFVPGTDHALVAGGTRWEEHLPKTAVVDVNLVDLTSVAVDVPNCTAPIAVLPDGQRALLSPTFCEEGQASTPKEGWTNPDPVSVIDLTTEGPQFLKNLPGFGPVALHPQGTVAVAYLDVERMDESMFDDKKQIPSKSGKRYHLMTIDPKSLAFDLTPIGDSLPRFVLSKSGGSLLVDATVMQVRDTASVKASIDSSGKVSVSFDVFGLTDSLLGKFDIATRTYAPIEGPVASLDRFVQMGDQSRIFTLKTRADGLGGDLYRIDLWAAKATSLDTSLRDIGLLPDGATLLLRIRLAAAGVSQGQKDVNGKEMYDWYRRELYCLSPDGLSCSAQVELQDSKPFMSDTVCGDYHDC